MGVRLTGSSQKLVLIPIKNLRKIRFWAQFGFNFKIPKLRKCTCGSDWHKVLILSYFFDFCFFKKGYFCQEVDLEKEK